jgi:ribonuclease P protein component
MHTEGRLRQQTEFDAVRQKGRWWTNSLLSLQAMANGLERNRFGFLVSKKVGKAVVRNRTKRRLKEIMRRRALSQGWDIVLIAKPKAAGATFEEMMRSVEDLLNRGRLAGGTAAGQHRNT